MTPDASMTRARRLRLGFACAAFALLALGIVLASPGRAHADSFPTITSISPASGPARGGTAITVTGTDFLPGARLYIGGTETVGAARMSSSVMTGVIAASEGGNGRGATVMVVNPDSSVATLTSGFFLTGTEAPLSVSGVAASSGPNSGGTTVTISGGGFNGAAAVLFGDIPATNINVLGASAIFARTPPNVSGTVPITITNRDGSSALLAKAFTYTGGVTTSTVTPLGGPLTGGTTIRIDGTGFARGATVIVGDAAATSVLYVNSSQLVATTPPGSLGPVRVTVTNPDGQLGAMAQAFSYGPPPNSTPPVISSLSPTNGLSLGGTQVTLSGIGFSGGASVYFGSVQAASVAWNGPSSMFVKTPSNVSGPLTVRVVNSDGSVATLPNGFTYEGGAGMSLSNATPLSVSASGGTLVTVTAAGINPGSWVTFNGIPATVSTVIGVAQIAGVAPAGLTGPVTVGVTQIGGVSATLATPLTVTGASTGTPTPVPTPVVTPLPTPVLGGAGSFLVTPIFSPNGQALVIFGGGSTDQLEAAAAAVKATGAWAQDGTGVYQLLVVGGPVFLKDQFKAKFGAGIGANAPMSLTR